MEKMQKKVNTLETNSTIYFILSILGLNIIAYALIQNDFNNFTIAKPLSTEETNI
ncbi:MAG: hypothetical protein ACLRZ9_08045 [Eubacterium sp.]